MSNVIARLWWGAIALMLVFACVKPTPEPSPPAPLGGSGGTMPAAAGGDQAALGGADASGGSSSVVWPKCDATKKQVAKRYPLQPRRHVIKRRPKASYQLAPDVQDRFFAPLLISSLDQLQLGACTGNAPLGVRLSYPYRLATLPAPWNRVTSAREFQLLARDIYSAATMSDPFPGSWPPTDTGSNGDSAMRIALQKGLFDGYRSIERFVDLQVALQSNGCIFGSDWYTGMFSPDRGGQVHLTGVIEGGHEYAFAGIDVARKLLWFVNSWGDDYGCKFGTHGGYFNMTFGTFQALFDAGGEVECPLPPANDNAAPLSEAA